jgi:D-proline reductase (dithiol) PrdB
VGLAQRSIEAAGITTVSLSMIHEFTRSVGAPRVAAIEYPMGQPLGKPHDPEGQLAVLRATLQVARDAQEPGSVVHLPFEWPDPPSRVRQEPAVLAPIVALIAREPWLFKRLLTGDIPESRS